MMAREPVEARHAQRLQLQNQRSWMSNDKSLSLYFNSFIMFYLRMRFSSWHTTTYWKHIFRKTWSQLSLQQISIFQQHPAWSYHFQVLLGGWSCSSQVLKGVSLFQLPCMKYFTKMMSHFLASKSLSFSITFSKEEENTKKFGCIQRMLNFWYTESNPSVRGSDTS